MIPMLEFLSQVRDVRDYIPKFAFGNFINYSAVSRIIMEDESKKESQNTPVRNSKTNEPISINIYNQNYSNVILLPDQKGKAEQPGQIYGVNNIRNDKDYINQSQSRKNSFSIRTEDQKNFQNNQKKEPSFLNNFINYTPKTFVKQNSFKEDIPALNSNYNTSTHQPEKVQNQPQRYSSSTTGIRTTIQNNSRLNKNQTNQYISIENEDKQSNFSKATLINNDSSMINNRPYTSYSDYVQPANRNSNTLKKPGYNSPSNQQGYGNTNQNSYIIQSYDKKYDNRDERERERDNRNDNRRTSQKEKPHLKISNIQQFNSPQVQSNTSKQNVFPSGKYINTSMQLDSMNNSRLQTNQTTAYKDIHTRSYSSIGTKESSRKPSTTNSAALNFSEVTNDIKRFIDKNEYDRFKESLNRKDSDSRKFINNSSSQNSYLPSQASQATKSQGYITQKNSNLVTNFQYTTDGSNNIYNERPKNRDDRFNDIRKTYSINSDLVLSQSYIEPSYKRNDKDNSKPSYIPMKENLKTNIDYEDNKNRLNSKYNQNVNQSFQMSKPINKYLPDTIKRSYIDPNESSSSLINNYNSPPSKSFNTNLYVYNSKTSNTRAQNKHNSTNDFSSTNYFSGFPSEYEHKKPNPVSSYIRGFSAHPLNNSFIENETYSSGFKSNFTRDNYLNSSSQNIRFSESFYPKTNYSHNSLQFGQYKPLYSSMNTIDKKPNYSNYTNKELDYNSMTRASRYGNMNNY